METTELALMVSFLIDSAASFSTQMQEQSKIQEIISTSVQQETCCVPFLCLAFTRARN